MININNKILYILCAFSIITMSINGIQSKNKAIYFNPDFTPTTIPISNKTHTYNYNPDGKPTVIDYYGIPQLDYITPKEASNYSHDAYLHKDYSKSDDMFDKLYWDRVDGDEYSMFANRESDDDFIWNY